MWLWLRTEPARLLDKIKVHCSWQRNDGEKGDEALPDNNLETELKMPVKTVQPRSAGDKMQPHALIWV